LHILHARSRARYSHVLRGGGGGSNPDATALDTPSGAGCRDKSDKLEVAEWTKRWTWLDYLTSMMLIFIIWPREGQSTEQPYHDLSDMSHMTCTAGNAICTVDLGWHCHNAIFQFTSVAALVAGSTLATSGLHVLLPRVTPTILQYSLLQAHHRHASDSSYSLIY
jgi:hypothetical protein